MNIDKYKIFWELNYPEVLPIGYQLKWIYNDRWFRIHSLPKSKRYAQTSQEFQVILNRQNQLITDLVGKDKKMMMLIGLYNDEVLNQECQKLVGFKDFTLIERLKLHQLQPNQYEEETIYSVFVKIEKWQISKYNEILIAIASDEFRMMLIEPEKKTIIIPYDGGIDIIMEKPSLKNSMKIKYKDWLSEREDGL